MNKLINSSYRELIEFGFFVTIGITAGHFNLI